MKHPRPTRRPLRLLALVLTLAACLAATACGSNEHMYRHNRSHCDCPTF